MYWKYWNPKIVHSKYHEYKRHDDFNAFVIQVTLKIRQSHISPYYVEQPHSYMAMTLLSPRTSNVWHSQRKIVWREWSYTGSNETHEYTHTNTHEILHEPNKQWTEWTSLHVCFHETIALDFKQIINFLWAHQLSWTSNQDSLRWRLASWTAVFIRSSEPM